MPIDAPEISVDGRFEPAYLTQDDITDLSGFTGLPADLCRKRVHAYSMDELAQAWNRVGPRTPDEIVAFYKDTDLYIWELMQWHASAARQPYWEALKYVARNCPPEHGWRSVYDFGCGIGTDALFLASRGYDVTLVDVDGPAFRFARHRFERRGLQARFVESTLPLPAPDGRYDIVVCFDVFEHLVDPVSAARRLVGALRNRGVLLQRGTFEDGGTHPCHLVEGVRRFGGLRWHIELAGLGLRNVSGLVYRRSHGLERVVQRARYALWQLTGAWMVRVGA